MKYYIQYVICQKSETFEVLSTGIFKILKEKGIQNPIVFWGMAELKHPSLSRMALKLLQILAASAQIGENLAYINSDMRICQIESEIFRHGIIMQDSLSLVH